MVSQPLWYRLLTFFPVQRGEYIKLPYFWGTCGRTSIAFVPVGFVMARTCILQETTGGQHVVGQNLDTKFSLSQKIIVPLLQISGFSHGPVAGRTRYFSKHRSSWSTVDVLATDVALLRQNCLYKFLGFYISCHPGLHQRHHSYRKHCDGVNNNINIQSS